MAVVLRAGQIGSVEPYAINGFELMDVGPLNGRITTLGEADSGDCTIEPTALLGRRN